MTRFELSAAAENLPTGLSELSDHPERGKWQVAILLRKPQLRWPGWPLEHALAVVDSRLQIQQAAFLILPPNGWEQNDASNLPPHLSEARVVAEGLSARQALTTLNSVFGNMLVFTNRSMMDYLHQSNFERGAALRATWSQASLLTGIGDCLTISIGEDAVVEFRALHGRGRTIADRAVNWAKSYINCYLARNLFVMAVKGAANADQVDRKFSWSGVQALKEIEIMQRAEALFGSPQVARQWYNKSPIPGFGGVTAKKMVEDGQSNFVMEYLKTFLNHRM